MFGDSYKYCKSHLVVVHYSFKLTEIEEHQLIVQIQKNYLLSELDHRNYSFRVINIIINLLES